MASRGRTGRRPVLTCGILEHGFARIRCGACAHEYLLAFPCRCFCPSCHANRLAIWAQWLDTTLLAPVSHWHVVLTILTRLRAYCRYGRRLLGEIARVATRTVTAALRTLTGERDLVVGIVACLQTHGSRANWHPHLHLIVTDGGFRPEGTFVSWPVHDTARLTEAVGRAVLLLFFRLAVCDEDQATGMLAWPHSGFHVQTATCRRRRGSPQTTVPSRSASRAIARGTPWRRGATAERTAPRRLPPRPPAAGRPSYNRSSRSIRSRAHSAPARCGSSRSSRGPP